MMRADDFSMSMQSVLTGTTLCADTIRTEAGGAEPYALREGAR